VGCRDGVQVPQALRMMYDQFAIVHIELESCGNAPELYRRELICEASETSKLLIVAI
jgi:hypothetical protein